MIRKRATMTSTVKASDSDGTATAIFSRFGGPPDSDGDITLPTAFTAGVVVPVSPWNHSSYSSDLPAGLGTIRVYKDRAEAEIEFFLDTVAGRETYRTLKALGRCQWSYGFDIVKSSNGDWNGRGVRVLEKLDVMELSPVLRGAGRDTETVNVRSAAATRQAAAREYARFVRTTHLGG